MDRCIKLSEWIIREVDGVLTPDEFRQLEQLLSKDPKALDFYINSYLSISSFMEPIHLPQEVFGGQEMNDISDSRLWQAMAEIEKSAETIEVAPVLVCENKVQTTPVVIKHRISRMSIAAVAMSAAALLLMVAFVCLYPRTAGPVVGILTETMDAKWQNGLAPVQMGQDLRAGMLALEHGLAQIQFDSGASVILEGPVQVDLLTANSMALRHGKIVATVGRDAVGFVVQTPQSKILDLGTEFGIEVEPSGLSKVHVFQGEVALYPANDGIRQNVSQGSAKSVDLAGNIETISLRAEGFVRQEELHHKQLARMGDSYSRWKSWVYEIHRDPSLMAHYFDAVDVSDPKILVNTAPQTQNQFYGQFGDEDRKAPGWITGRWPEKQSVRFVRGNKEAIIIPVGKEMMLEGPVTVSVWILYPDMEQMGGHIISCMNPEQVFFQFSYFDRKYLYDFQCNKYEFIRYAGQNNKGLYSQEFVPQTGVWYHIAVAYDTQFVCFYVNGTLFDRQPYENTIMPQDSTEAEIIIGTVKMAGPSKYRRVEGDFDGIIDELMIFKRSLTGEELKAIYEVGMPASETN